MPRILEFDRGAGDPLRDIKRLLKGRVFHVTSSEGWLGISETKEVQPNYDNSRGSPFGSRPNGFFRKRGCISVFDYRYRDTTKIREYRNRCRPLDGAMSEGGIAILLLDERVHGRLIPWTQWKVENALSDMVVPYVEAGHPGSISLDDIVTVILLKVEPEPAIARMHRMLAVRNIETP